MNRFVEQFGHIPDLSKWYSSRPKVIKELLDEFPLYCTVRVKETNQKGVVQSYFEDGTMSVAITHINMRTPQPPIGVFGFKPDDLEFLDLWDGG